MIDSFINHLKFEKRASRHTILAYQTDLQQFESFLRANFGFDLSSSNHATVRSWIAGLAESGLDPTSINRKIASLRAYFKFLQKQQVIVDNPMARIRTMKSGRKLPSFLKESEITTILDEDLDQSLTDEKTPFERLRDNLVLELFYGTGIRLSELINLKEIDVDVRNQTVKVLGKRNKERIIPFGDNLMTLIKEYRRLKRKDITGNSDGFLLVTKTGEPCYPMLIYRIVKSRLARISAEKKSPHVLRHTYATHLLDNGAEINAVKELLGHSSLAATQVYTHNSIEKLKKVFNQAHPKA